MGAVLGLEHGEVDGATRANVPVRGKSWKMQRPGQCFLEGGGMFGLVSEDLAASPVSPCVPGVTPVSAATALPAPGPAEAAAEPLRVLQQDGPATSSAFSPKHVFPASSKFFPNVPHLQVLVPFPLKIPAVCVSPLVLL